MARSSISELPSQSPGSSNLADQLDNMAGGSTVQLWLPFSFQGRVFREITFRPFTYDDTVLWNEGKFDGARDLMVRLIVGMDEVAVRQIRYPDFPRVFRAFMELVPDEIADDIRTGKRPTEAPAAPEAFEEEPRPPAAPDGQASQEAPPEDHDDGGLNIEPQ